jgi:hypothetical protein
MGEPAMELTQSQLQQIADYVKSQLPDWVYRSEPPNKEIHDRILVVEQELKAQRELMSQGFEAMDKRFESLQHNMDKRFEAMDSRFESLQHNMDKRFEAMDSRFESLQHNMDKRFEAVDRRFSMLQWMWGGGIVLITLLMSLYEFVS